MFTTLIHYVLVIGPGLVVFTACLLLARRLSSPGLSIAVLIAAFILIRDAMTPTGLWRIGSAGGLVPWIRFTTDTALLAVLGAVTLGLTVAIVATHPRLRGPHRVGTASSRPFSRTAWR